MLQWFLELLAPLEPILMFTSPQARSSEYSDTYRPYKPVTPTTLQSFQFARADVFYGLGCGVQGIRLAASTWKLLPQAWLEAWL